MAEHETIEPEYTGTVGGAYSTEEHLKAQQEQISAQTGKPLIDPADVAHPADAGDHDDPAAPADTETPAVGGDKADEQPLG